MPPPIQLVLGVGGGVPPVLFVSKLALRAVISVQF